MPSPRKPSKLENEKPIKFKNPKPGLWVRILTGITQVFYETRDERDHFAQVYQKNNKLIDKIN